MDLPTDLTQYLEPAYKLGARIMSSSWGADSAQYDSKSVDVDSFVWENKVIQSILIIKFFNKSQLIKND